MTADSITILILTHCVGHNITQLYTAYKHENLQCFMYECLLHLASIVEQLSLHRSTEPPARTCFPYLPAGTWAICLRSSMLRRFHNIYIFRLFLLELFRIRGYLQAEYYGTSK